MNNNRTNVKPARTNNILTVMKKEFARFFGDRRMIFTAMIFPGLMIYVLYTFMGVGFNKMFAPNEDHIPLIYAANLPESMYQTPFSIVEIGGSEAEDAKGKVAAKLIDLLIVFPIDFDAKVAAYDVSTGDAAPDVQIFYNSSSEDSNHVFMSVSSMLDAYEKSLANKFDINRDVPSPDLVSERDASGSVMSSILPLLLTIFMFTGCLSLATESIAGEKERGTIATLLVTPLKRSELALGKVLSLGCLAFLCGLSSTLGTVLSLPKLTRDMGGMNMNIYSATDFLSLGLVILSTILLFVTLISIISAFAKTVKEATSLSLR